LPEHSVGHNPLGAGSVLALLFFLFLQVLSGSFSDDEIAFAGPLAKYVSNASVSLATSYHKVFGKYLLLALVLLHVAAIVFYRLKKKQNLAAAMLHGDKQLDYPAQPSRDDARSRWLAVGVFVACAALVAGAVHLVD
jgi:cytochrome b